MWELLAAADRPCSRTSVPTLDFLKTAAWRDAPAFVGWKAGEEFQMDPWTLSTLHLPVQNFLATMVLGGVFERHPRLRFGSCEVLAQWVGPLAQNLDFWHPHSRKFSLDNMEGELPITMQPSDYIRRNVRAVAVRHRTRRRLHRAVRHARDLLLLERLPAPRGRARIRWATSAASWPASARRPAPGVRRERLMDPARLSVREFDRS